MDEVRGDVELDVLLNGETDDENENHVLSRLTLALRYNEKKVKCWGQFLFFDLRVVLRVLAKSPFASRLRNSPW